MLSVILIEYLVNLSPNLTLIDHLAVLVCTFFGHESRFFRCFLVFVVVVVGADVTAHLVNNKYKVGSGSIILK